MNIYQKLIEVRKTVPYLQKESQGQQYKYVGSSQVLGNVREKMDELQLLLVPSVTGHSVSESAIEYKNSDGDVTKRTTTFFTELDMTMTWVNAENPEETIICPWYGQGVDIAGEKGVGKALTYAEKYFMLKFFNIPTDKDDPDSFQKKYEDEPEPPKQQPRRANQQDALKPLEVNWPNFWKSIKQLGYTEAEVKKIAGVSDITKLSRAKVDDLYKDLKVRKTEMNFLGDEKKEA